MNKHTAWLHRPHCRRLHSDILRMSLVVFSLIPVMVQAQRSGPPNMLILFADDLGWSEISTNRTNDGNGSLYHQTPQIDALAEQGLSFTNAYAQQNCAPTRTALMSGQYATRTKSYNVTSLDRGNGDERFIPAENIEDIQPNIITIAEALQDAGYTTAHFGKTHAWKRRDGTTVHGWDESFAVGRRYLATLINDRWRFEGSFANLDAYAQPYDAAYLDKLRPFENNYDVDTLLDTTEHITDALTDAAIDFMRPPIANSQPFFAFVAFHAVHKPLVPRADIAAKYNTMPSTDWRHPSPEFAAFVETLDQAVGRMVAFLDDPDGDPLTNDSVANNTVVLFLSDNGGRVGIDQSPLRGNKGTLWGGGVRVPMIARMPGWIAPMTVTDEVVHVIDLYPTLVELAGGTYPPPDMHVLDGESFVGLLDGTQSTLDRQSIYWHFPGYLDTRIPQPLSVIIKRFGGTRYKLLYFYETEHYELYDLDNDLSETIDRLAGTPTSRDLLVASSMAEDLKSWLLATGADFPLIPETMQPVPPPPAVVAPCDSRPGMLAEEGRSFSCLLTFEADEAFLNNFNQTNGSERFTVSSVGTGTPASNGLDLTTISGTNSYDFIGSTFDMTRLGNSLHYAVDIKFGQDAVLDSNSVRIGLSPNGGRIYALYAQLEVVDSVEDTASLFLQDRNPDSRSALTTTPNVTILANHWYRLTIQVEATEEASRPTVTTSTFLHDIGTDGTSTPTLVASLEGLESTTPEGRDSGLTDLLNSAANVAFIQFKPGGEVALDNYLIDYQAAPIGALKDVITVDRAH